MRHQSSPMTIIRTKHLILRDFQSSDLDAYRALRDDAKFQRFYSESDASIERSEQLLNMFIQQSTEEPRTRFQLAVVSNHGDLMGSCGVRIEAPGQASVGCELGRRWHGSGAAREATQAIVDFGFHTLGVDRLYAETISANRAAIALCRSVGMRIEAERVDDQFFKGKSWSTVVLALLASEWRARSALPPRST